MPAITKAMRQDAVDTARGHIESIAMARSTGEANWMMGKAHGLLEFAQVWSIMDAATAIHMRDEAHKAFRRRATQLRSGAGIPGELAGILATRLGSAGSVATDGGASRVP